MGEDEACDTPFQGVEVGRLADELRAAGRQRVIDVLLAVRRRQRDDRRLEARLAKTSCGARAVHAWQVEIKHNRVDPIASLAQNLQPRLSIRRKHRFET